MSHSFARNCSLSADRCGHEATARRRARALARAVDEPGRSGAVEGAERSLPGMVWAGAASVGAFSPSC